MGQAKCNAKLFLLLFLTKINKSDLSLLMGQGSWPLGRVLPLTPAPPLPL